MSDSNIPSEKENILRSNTTAPFTGITGLMRRVYDTVVTLRNGDSSIPEVDVSKDSCEDIGTTLKNLESRNFCIDSTGWGEVMMEDDIHIKMNPEGDAIEFVGGKFHGEQHFSYDAMIRETTKAGKRIPTPEEWQDIIENYLDGEGGSNPTSIHEVLGLNLSGYCNTHGGKCYGQDISGYCWAYSSEGTHVLYMENNAVPSVSGLPAGYKKYRYPVRCLKT